MQLAIIGAGGHGRELASIARAQHGESIEISFWDDNLEKGDHPFGEVRGRIDELSDASASHLLIGVGDPATRASMANRYEVSGLIPLTAIHPSAQVGERCAIGAGSVLGPGSVVTCDTVIGAHTHIHANVVISHDCELEDFVVVTPGVSIAGDVTIRELSWIGVGSTINRGLEIGRAALVGAGAVVINDVEAADVVAGVPARSLSPERQR